MVLEVEGSEVESGSGEGRGRAQDKARERSRGWGWHRRRLMCSGGGVIDDRGWAEGGFKPQKDQELRAAGGEAKHRRSGCHVFRFET